MRCPKCQYISFDSGDRCRNCGYEFSLTVDETPVEVKIARDEPPPGRIRDVALGGLDAQLSSPGAPGGADRDEAGVQPLASKRPLTMSDLPLFTERIADDQAPLVTPPAVPRPPLSVRRANPAGRSRPHAPLPEELSLDLAAELEESEKGPLDVFIPEPLPGAPAAAGIVRRIGAGIIDLLVLGAIDATVVYLTLRLCELTVNDWRTLPFAPLIAFLLLLSGGYFVLFAAAGGQTIGKMATGIRVIYAPITATAHPRVSFGTAVVRTVACLGSVLALGAGFLPVLFNDDRRAFHDRIAETRVVLA